MTLERFSRGKKVRSNRADGWWCLGLFVEGVKFLYANLTPEINFSTECCAHNTPATDIVMISQEEQKIFVSVTNVQ